MSSFERFERKRSISFMKSNVAYIQVCNKNEKIEISSECTDDDFQELLRSISGAGRRDVLKLTNFQNVALPLKPSSIMYNLPTQPYRLEVISCCPQLYTTLLSQGAKTSLQNLDTRVQNIELKLQSLFHKVHGSCSNQVGELEGRVHNLQNEVDNVHLSRKIGRDNLHVAMRPRNTSETAARCSSCPYFSNMHQSQQFIHLNDLVATTNHRTPSCDWQRITKTHEQIHTVWTQYQSLRMSEIRRSVREGMKLPSFNMWSYTDAELIQLVKFMFEELQLTIKFSIPSSTLDRWLFAIYQHYNSVPFHNFTHAFCVVQMVYAIIHIARLHELYDDLDILILLFSAMSHDLDHPGLNNAFQINARTYLAQRYNDKSPLENHHCAIAFQLLEDEDKNILKQLTAKQFKTLREISIKCILSTDMARHGDIVSEFRSLLHSVDTQNEQARKTMVLVVVIKACDISNEARPPQVSEAWLECLLAEFFQQSDLEKRRGLPFLSFMDRDKVNKSNSQCGFIKFVILPLFELLVEMFPSLEEHLMKPVKSQLEFYNKQQSPSTNPEPISPVNPPRSNINPVRKISTGSIATPKFNIGCTTRRQSLSVNDPSQGAVFFGLRKTSTGSIPSRKSSTGSMVLAQS